MGTFGATLIQASYFVAAALFILGLKRMSSPVTARSGIVWAGVGMVVATLITFLTPGMGNYGLMTVAIAIGGIVAWVTGRRVAMTDMPQMIALYNGMGGGAAGAIAAVELFSGEAHSVSVLALAVLGGIIGAVSFSGSLIAFAKLQGLIKRSIRFPGQNHVNIAVLIAALVAGGAKDKVALVVGAGSSGPGWGNGKATAVAFAREGAMVACADYRLDAAQETAAIIQKEGGDAVAIKADVVSGEDIENMVSTAVEFFGRVDILDYNVGLAEVGGVVEISEAEWDRIFDVNLKGAMLSMKHVIPLMEKQGGGSIINISSIAGIRYTGVDYPTYYATKAALNHLTRATAAQYAKKNIRVNAILPGLMKTPMVEHSPALKAAYGKGDVEKMWAARAAQVPMGKMGDAWDVANAAVFLASDESRYITGIELVVDGGVTLKYA